MSERLRFVLARCCDDIAWPFFLVLVPLPSWFGVCNPRWLRSVVLGVTQPLQEKALRLRGWANGVSGS